ncbi:beta strand repeat-containing protein [Caproicibacterium argilliputei]|uniref:BIG2 domain-containing protein n=1 Tax=Caproicibacterium argilliputei TaxID=3030016 RepID=A0AA97DAG0_9FIRM|nr:hypothetical protein [Caproicibacterium argilliputei]WOC32020.1 hypothetical protein PXC00_12620 [Caproicibacterium argilliputei]
MNKKMSRIAAIALSAAMVTSAFAMSTSSAFAATTPTISTTAQDIAAVYDSTAGAANTFTLPTKIVDGATINIGDNKESVDVNANQNANDKYNWVSSDNNVATVNNTTGEVKLGKANKKVTFTAYGTADFGKIETGKHNQTAQYKATSVKMTVNVYVYANNAALVLPTDATMTAGTYVDSDVTASFNQTKEFGVYTVKAGSDAQATYEAASGYDFATGNSNIPLVDPADTQKTVTTVSNAAAVTVAAQPASAVKTGATTITAYVHGDKDATAVPATLTVDNTYTLSADAEFNGVRSFGQETATNNVTADDDYNLTNVAVKLNSHKLTVDEDALVGAVSGAGDVALQDGTVASITGATNVTTDVDNATTRTTAPTVKVGDITGATAVTATGSVDPVNGKYGTISLGNISTKNLTVVTTQDADEAAQGLVTIGNVTASGAVSVTTTSDAKTLTLGTISGTQGAFADCPFDASFALTAGKFTTGDLKNIGRVTVNAGAELTTGAIATGTVGTASDACGDNSADTSIVKVNGKLNAKSIYTQASPDGTGTIIIPANSFTIAANGQINTHLNLTVTNATVGSVLYTTNYASSGAFNMPGFTTVESANVGKNVYNYVVKAAELQGILLDNADVAIGDGSSATLKASTVPNLSLPTGVSVKWTASKDSVSLTPSADSLSCAVKSTGYTAANINGSNNVVVTATLVNKDGTVYKPFGTTLSSQDAQITLTAEQAPVLTTKVQNLGDTEAKAVTADTVVKMTQSTYATVDFSADKAGITAADLKYGTGNGKVAETGTYDPWNGTAGKYYIYANGKVGDKVGVYANGQKIFQVEIVDRPFTSDTTVDFAMKAGSKYQFKITPNADTTIKDFAFNTANDAALSTWGFTKNADGTVTATIKANKAGKYGVYCDINGVKYKVFAVTVK